MSPHLYEPGVLARARVDADDAIIYIYIHTRIYI